MSDCGVCIGGGSCAFEFTDYYSSIELALVDLECEECERPILAGSQYENAGGEDEEGDDHDYITCMDCSNIAEGLSCDRRVHSTLWSDLEESDGFENFSEACIAKVSTVSAKKYLRDRWLRWNGLA